VAVPFGEEKPVAAPCNVSANRPCTGNIDDERTFLAPTGNVGDRNFTVFVQSGSDNPDGCFNAMLARINAAHVRKSCDETDGSMAAHAEVTDIVKKNDSGGTGGIGRFEKGSADDDIGAARFVHDCRAEPVVLVAENVQSLLHAAAAEFGSPADNDPSRFATGVRVYDGDSSHADVSSFFVRGPALRRVEDKNECPFPLILDRAGTFGRAVIPS